MPEGVTLLLGSELDNDYLESLEIDDVDFGSTQLRFEQGETGGPGRYFLYDDDVLVREIAGPLDRLVLEEVIENYDPDTHRPDRVEGSLTAGGTHLMGTTGPDASNDPEDPTQVSEEREELGTIADRRRREAEATPNSISDAVMGLES